MRNLTRRGKSSAAGEIRLNYIHMGTFQQGAKSPLRCLLFAASDECVDGIGKRSVPVVIFRRERFLDQKWPERFQPPYHSDSLLRRAWDVPPHINEQLRTVSERSPRGRDQLDV